MRTPSNESEGVVEALRICAGAQAVVNGSSAAMDVPVRKKLRLVNSVILSFRSYSLCTVCWVAREGKSSLNNDVGQTKRAADCSAALESASSDQLNAGR
jgi:hypothetical protein